MVSIKVGNKTLVIEDGCNVEVSGDEIKVSPGTPTASPLPWVVPVAPIQTPWPWPNYTQPYWAPSFPTCTGVGGVADAIN